MFNNSRTLWLGGSLALAGAAAAYALLVRTWQMRWGASDIEIGLSLPVDELLPNPHLEATHRVTILAPPAIVWSWLVQIGQGRDDDLISLQVRRLFLNLLLPFQ